MNPVSTQKSRIFRRVPDVVLLVVQRSSTLDVREVDDIIDRFVSDHPGEVRIPLDR